jgi:hypothetical protein
MNSGLRALPKMRIGLKLAELEGTQDHHLPGGGVGALRWLSICRE